MCMVGTPFSDKLHVRQQTMHTEHAQLTITIPTHAHSTVPHIAMPACCCWFLTFQAPPKGQPTGLPCVQGLLQVCSNCLPVWAPAEPAPA